MIGYRYTYLDSSLMNDTYLTLDVQNSGDIIGLVLSILFPIVCIFIFVPFVQKIFHKRKLHKEKIHKKKLLEQILIQKDLEEEIEKQVHLEEEK